MRRAADIRPLLVEWLWTPRVPLGMLTLFAGDPKVGKSFVSLGMSASVSRGVALPGDDAPAGPGGVVLLSAEDDPARTIVPRLRSAGADMERIHIFESVYLSDGAEALPSLRVDLEEIEAAVASVPNCRLVVIDPVSAYLAGTDDHRNGELRGMLSPLKAMAERTGTAVVLVTHMNKTASANSKHRVQGSIAYVGACRANFLFIKDRDDPTFRRVLMCENGCNLAGDIPSLAYSIVDSGHGPTVLWESGTVATTAEQALAKEIEAAEDPAKRAESAAVDTWLRDLMARGPVPAKDGDRDGRGAGYTPKQIRDARNRLSVRSRRQGYGKDGVWWWLRPDQAIPDGDGEAPIDAPDPP
jgi:hypothetical protein